MARSKPKDPQATAEVDATPPAVEEEGERENLPELIDPSPIMPAQPQEPAADVPVERYRVEAEKKIMHRGTMTILRTGKVVRGCDYNVADLLTQGVKLTKL